MDFHDNGTISVDIDGQTYTLRRPNMGQMWEFFDLREELSNQAQKTIKDYAEELAEIDEESDRGKEIQEALSDRRFTFRFMSEPWLRKAFEDLGSKPLPENLDAAPSELADPSLPNQILMFWREVPLAHSRRRV